MLVVKGLEKSYGKTKILKGLGFHVAPGRVYSLIGKNGAGKTTTIKCIMGFLRKNGGTVSIKGIDPSRDLKSALKLTGYVPQKLALPADLKVLEVVQFTADVRDVSKRKALDLLEEMDLYNDRKKRVRELSGGMLQRLGIVLALLGEPELLIMDEPMLNLDPTWQENLKAKLKELKKQNTAVLLSIHNLRDAEEISDIIGVISDGVIVKEGSGDILRAGVTVRSRMRLFTNGNSAHAFEVLKRSGFSPVLADSWIDLSITPPEKMKAVDTLQKNSIFIRDFYIEDIPLEEIVADLYEKYEKRRVPKEHKNRAVKED
ncbi:MAG: ABC transporter ATP-binding protein [bacterium]|nr:ABC transporter ATP-binding protein [bacterium]